MKKNILFSVCALVALWAGWLIAYNVVKNDYILPSFWDTLKEAGRLFVTSAFWRAFAKTLLRTLYAFVFSVIFGVVLALIASRKGYLQAFFAPIISALRTLPTMAIILALLIWTSPSVAPVIVTCLVLFPSVYVSALASFLQTEGEYGALVRAYGIPFLRQIFKIYLPLSALSLGKQLGSILSMGLKITISAEVLSNTYQSLGGMLQEAKLFVEMPTLLALTLLAVLLGFLLEGVCALLNLCFARWWR